MVDPWFVLGAAMLEAIVSYPAALHRGIPHPVAWMGAALAWCEARWNNPHMSAAARKFRGILTLIFVAGAAGFVGLLIIDAMPRNAWGMIVIALAATLGLAQRSLYDHVNAVRRALDASDLQKAREAVAAVVGRDVATLDDSGVAAAALESLAESFNDGVVAPVFWLTVGGLPGLFIYKAVNTADSMIGHKEPRWKDFGCAAARTDDVLNWIPARIAGLLIVVAGRGGLKTMLADAHKHASPNAGWPEAAMAGALRVRLGGPAAYDGIVHARPTFGQGPWPTPDHLRKGLRIYLIACGVMYTTLFLGGWLWRQ